MLVSNVNVIIGVMCEVPETYMAIILLVLGGTTNKSCEFKAPRMIDVVIKVLLRLFSNLVVLQKHILSIILHVNISIVLDFGSL